MTDTPRHSWSGHPTGCNPAAAAYRLHPASRRCDLRSLHPAAIGAISVNAKHGDGKCRSCSCCPPFHFNLRSASLWSGLRLDESFRRHFESGYALDKGCFQPAYAINQA